MSNLQVNRLSYAPPMDIFEARRQVLLDILASAQFKGRRKDLAAAIDVQPSYLTRMLSEPGTTGRKRLGDEVAVKIESMLDLEPGRMINPVLHVREPRSTYIVDTTAVLQASILDGLAQILAALPAEQRAETLLKLNDRFLQDAKIIRRAVKQPVTQKLPAPGRFGSVAPQKSPKKRSSK